jgi:hypothetical protein
MIDACVSFGPGLRAQRPYGPLYDATTAPQLVKMLDRVGIDQAVVHPPDWHGGWAGVDFVDPNYETGNSAIAEAVRAFRGRLIGFARVNPKFGRGAARELRRCFEEYGFRGLFLNSEADGYDPTNLPLLQPVVEACLEFEWPLLVHTGFPPAQPFRFLELARAYPQLKVVLGHMGGQAGAMVTDAIIAAQHSENIYLESSGTIVLVFTKALRAIGAERIVFGTGWPYNIPEVEIERVRSAQLLDSEFHAIVRRNVADLIGLEPREQV